MLVGESQILSVLVSLKAPGTVAKYTTFACLLILRLCCFLHRSLLRFWLLCTLLAFIKHNYLFVYFEAGSHSRNSHYIAQATVKLSVRIICGNYHQELEQTLYFFIIIDILVLVTKPTALVGKRHGQKEMPSLLSQWVLGTNVRFQASTHWVTCQILSSTFNGGKLVQLFKPQKAFWIPANINIWISTKLFLQLCLFCINTCKCKHMRGHEGGLSKAMTYTWQVKGQLVRVNSLLRPSRTQISYSDILYPLSHLIDWGLFDRLSDVYRKNLTRPFKWG